MTPELVALRKDAEALARARKETPSTAHLLASLAARPGPAGDLLRDRRLGAERVIAALDGAPDPEPLARTLERAEEMALRGGAAEASALHVLLAVLSDRNAQAHRVLARAAVDVARLRASTMQLALGLRRPAARSADQAPAPPAARQASRTAQPPPAAPRGRATAVPLLPPVPRAPHPGAATTRGKVAPATPVPLAAGVPVVAPSTAPSAVPDENALSGGGRRRARGPAAAPSAEHARFALDPKRFPMLAGLGRNLTLAAAQGELDPVVGRDVEVDQALDVLAKRHANNPCLVGPAGVGKTSVVRGLARRIAGDDAVASLDDRIVLEIPIAELMAGTGVRGSLAERIATLRAEVREARGRVVLFFDEIHGLFSELSDEVASELKLALARGELPCIGATTAEEYRRVIDADAALARRFTVVEVEEPHPDDALAVLRGLAPTLAGHHGVSYADDALASAVTWSVRYLPGRALPDKAVSVLDLAGARARRRSQSAVTARGVAEVVAELSDVPIERLLETDRARMLALEAILAERVVGHREPLARIARVLRRNAAGLRARRPIGTFLLLGPTGVGKTETAKAIAEALFHSDAAMTRFDLGELSEPHAVARLVGAPPGYVGHESGGQLTEAVRRRPYQVVLLDEIEKAHRDVLEAFLAVFDEGRMTDGRGRTVDFTNTVFVLTSNLGASEATPRPSRGIGFAREGDDGQSRAEAAVIEAARAALPPELYNRLDEVLVFAPLARADVAEVARRLLADLGRRLEDERDVRLEAEDDAIEALLLAGGYDPQLGARPMRRTVARLVEAPIAEMILRGEIQAGDVVLVGADDGRIVVDAVRSGSPAPHA